MAEERVQRRLAAILATDIVGYSRLMAADEAGTLARLKADRKELIEPKVTQYRGRTIKLMGDGALMEYESVVDAVTSAVEVQCAMRARNAKLPDDRQIWYRTGINVGDIIHDEGDIYGDGVNIAARLQALAEPGGICVSRTVHTHVKGKLDLTFENLGEREIKNIREPMTVYRVALDDKAAALVTPVIREAAKRERRPARVAAAAVAAIVSIGGALWWLLDRTPENPCIAVLPLTNMSGDPEQEYFSDGMTDGLITDLSKISDLCVIARNSTFVYKGKAVKISEVAEELGVRYVLEGSVQRDGAQMRVNAQLIDALTGGHVWSDRFDGKVEDKFSAQDAFVRKIVDALEIHLTKSEIDEMARTKAGNIAAQEAFDEGWNLYLRFNAQDNASAVGPLKKAIELDPEYGRGYAALALVHLRVLEYLWFREFGMDYDHLIPEIEYYLQNAKKYPTALAYAAEAQLHIYRGRAEEALRDARQAIALDPNDPDAHITLAWALTISGLPKEALVFVDSAIRLNPRYPSHYVLARGIALFAADDLKQAAQVLEEGFKQNRSAVALLPPLASMLAQLGRREEAMQALLIWRPGSSSSVLINIFSGGYIFPVRWKQEYARVRERLYDGMLVASLPLEVTVPSLMSELKGDNPFDQLIAVQRLGWFGPAAAPAVPALIVLLDDEIFRERAVQSLGKIGPAAKAAIPELVELQDEPIIGVLAKEALKQIRGY